MSSSTARHRAPMAHRQNASQAVAENRGLVRGGAVATAAAGILMASVAPANAEAFVDTTSATPAASTTTTSATTTGGTTTWTANGITYTWNGANIADGYRYFGLTGTAPATTGTAPATTGTAPATTGATPTASYSGAGEVSTAQTATKVSLASTASRSTGGNQAIVAAAYAGIGHPYVWGGTSTAGWDCSGFVQWAYAQAGKSIPRTFQWTAMTRTSSPKPGDLIVQGGGSHVGIYVGNGMEISALNPSQGTLLHSANAMSVDGYYTLG